MTMDYHYACVEWFNANEVNGRVLIRIIEETSSFINGWEATWEVPMNDWIGAIFLVTEEDISDLDYGIILYSEKNLDEDIGCRGGSWFFPIESFDVVKKCLYKGEED